MLIKTENFQKTCSLILGAIDSSELSTLTETLELVTKDKALFLNVTNKEYFISVRFSLDHEEPFHATVNAILFLKLVSQLTTEFIELEIKDTYVDVKANGHYKIPLIFDGVEGTSVSESLLKLPKIDILNPTLSMNISGNILQSILDYNSKELLKGTIAKPVQRLFYIDEEGCITFTSGACVNSFQLELPLKILINGRLVKLFKLFKDSLVKFTLGYDQYQENESQMLQTKVSFCSPDIELTAITNCEDTLLNSVPVAAIRDRAFTQYPNNIMLNKDLLSQAINRLLLFSAGYGSKTSVKPYSQFECKDNEILIYDTAGKNIEKLPIVNIESLNIPDYKMTLDLNDLKTILDGCTSEFVNLSFGNGQALVIARGAIRNILPECKVYTSE